jgi:uncharacterized protein (DUF302 family)
MAYYHKKLLENTSFEEAVVRTREALKSEGFGVLTEIDIRETLRKKLDVDFNPYIILGACNPPFAYKALQMENKIGTMLPCNVIVQEIADGTVEVAAINPVVSMKAVANRGLEAIAGEVNTRLRQVLDRL